MIQEFDIVIRDKKGFENVVADHLSRLVNEEVTQKEKEVRGEFPDEFLLAAVDRPWFVDIVNYKVIVVIP